MIIPIVLGYYFSVNYRSIVTSASFRHLLNESKVTKRAHRAHLVGLICVCRASIFWKFLLNWDVKKMGKRGENIYTQSLVPPNAGLAPCKIQLIMTGLKPISRTVQVLVFATEFVKHCNSLLNYLLAYLHTYLLHITKSKSKTQ